MSSTQSEYLNIIHSPLSIEPIRLRDYGGVRGILQNITPFEDNLILADLSGILVELPAELESKLQSLMGQRTRVAIILGKYHVARWRELA
jgi:hypothetical protein